MSDSVEFKKMDTVKENEILKEILTKLDGLSKNQAVEILNKSIDIVERRSFFDSAQGFKLLD